MRATTTTADGAPIDPRSRSGGRECPLTGCTAWSTRSHDPSRPGSDRHVWTCAAAHRVRERPARPCGPAHVAATPGAVAAGRRRSPGRDELAAAGRSMAHDADLGLDEFLHGLVETSTALAGADAGSLLLVSAVGRLRPAAASTEDPGVAEVAEDSATDGPGLQSFRCEQAVEVADVQRVDDRWPALRRSARRHGVRAIHAVPVLLHGEAIGSMGYFFADAGGLQPDAADALQGLVEQAVVATTGAHLTRAVHRLLDEALDSRVAIERAKGLLMAIHGIGPDAAETRMRGHAELRRVAVADVARQVVARVLDLPFEDPWSGPEARPDARPAADPPRSGGARRRVTAHPADADIARLLEQAASVHQAAGRGALARHHRARAAVIRRGSDGAR